MARKPWGPPIIEHQKAIDAWKAAVRNYSNPQPASIQQYLLYRFRFISAADIAHDFDSFSGAIAQFNNISILLNHAVIDSPAFAIAYDQHLHNKLATLARERTPSIDYFAMLPEEQYEIKRYISNSLSIQKGKSKKGGKGKESSPEGKRGSEVEPSNVYSTAASAAPAASTDRPADNNAPIQPNQKFRRLLECPHLTVSSDIQCQNDYSGG